MNLARFGDITSFSLMVRLYCHSRTPIQHPTWITVADGYSNKLCRLKVFRKKLHVLLVNSLKQKRNMFLFSSFLYNKLLIKMGRSL